MSAPGASRLTLAQAKIVCALASAHGHLWTLAVYATDPELVAATAAREECLARAAYEAKDDPDRWVEVRDAALALDPTWAAADAAYLAAQHAASARLPARAAALTIAEIAEISAAHDTLGPGGICSPGLDEKGWSAHSTLTGRLTWEVGPQGQAILGIWRPGPRCLPPIQVLRAHVDARGVTIASPRPAWGDRHAETLIAALDAIGVSTLEASEWLTARAVSAATLAAVPADASVETIAAHDRCARARAIRAVREEIPPLECGVAR